MAHVLTEQAQMYADGCVACMDVPHALLLCSVSPGNISMLFGIC